MNKVVSAFGLAALVLGSTPAESKGVWFRVYNDIVVESYYTQIIEVSALVCTKRQCRWSENLLKHGPLRSGTKTEITVPRGAHKCRVTLQAIFRDGEAAPEIARINVCKTRAWHVGLEEYE